MKSLPLQALRPPAWRRFGAGLALVASLGFAFQSTLVMAQATVEADAPAPAPAKPKPKVAKKPAHKVMPSDNVADELNRREAERVTKAAQPGAPQPLPAAPTAVPPAVAVAPAATTAVAVVPAKGQPVPLAVVMPAAKVVQASLTPGVGNPPLGAQPVQPVSLTPIATPDPAAPAPQPRQAQTRPPAPTPVQPPSASPQSPPAVVSGATTRPFAQSQVVPPQQPTLTLEVSKGTAIKLPGAATTVFVAAPDIADVQVKSPTMIYVFAKKPGDTVLYAVDDQDRVLLNTIVSVTSPISRMKTQLDALHPGNGIQIDNQGESIVLSGVSRSAVAAEDARKIALQHVGGVATKVINDVKIDAPNQVQLQVKIAEVKRTALKRIGVNLQNIQSVALFGIGIGRLGGATNTVQSVGGATSSAAVFFNSNDNSFTSFIDMLANQSEATILAEPNLVAMSGETATFLAGGEIPVITPQTSTFSNTITVTYKQVGVSLSFTPTIIGDRINLKVSPEVSQVTTDGQVSVPIGVNSSLIIPAIQTRRASTTVELGSGQSFAIGGLLNHTTSQTISKMPGLGDVPVLGSLFKSDAYQRNETELVILVTPYFVEPVSGRLRTPLSGRVPPSDVDRQLMQRFNHPTPPQRLSVGREQYAGPSAGFTLD